MILVDGQRVIINIEVQSLFTRESEDSVSRSVDYDASVTPLKRSPFS